MFQRVTITWGKQKRRKRLNGKIVVGVNTFQQLNENQTASICCMLQHRS